MVWAQIKCEITLYAQKSGFFDQCYTSTSINMMDDQTVWNIGKSEFTAEEVKKISESYKQFMRNPKIDGQGNEEAMQNLISFFKKMTEENK